MLVLGTEKGADTEARVKHNFGMARPEGYRKARRLMRLAERFALPVLTFVDTAGAYPGIDAEARGQSEAIARAIETCLDIRVPVVASVIGEGGSGGAIALAAANAVLMLDHATYSVISPEGCALILWRDGAHAKEGPPRRAPFHRAGALGGSYTRSCRTRWAAPTGCRWRRSRGWATRSTRPCVRSSRSTATACATNAAANSSPSATERRDSGAGLTAWPASLTGDGRSPHLAWRVRRTAPVAFIGSHPFLAGRYS